MSTFNLSWCLQSAQVCDAESEPQGHHISVLKIRCKGSSSHNTRHVRQSGAPHLSVLNGEDVSYRAHHVGTMGDVLETSNSTGSLVPQGLPLVTCSASVMSTRGHEQT